MKPLAWLLPLLLVGAWVAGSHLAPARAEDEVSDCCWEFKMVLIPLERKLELYEKANTPLLDPLQRLGQDGWELVSAFEPSHGFMAGDRASTEFWFKRRFVAKR
jgi:hypothetical protein